MFENARMVHNVHCIHNTYACFFSVQERDREWEWEYVCASNQTASRTQELAALLQLLSFWSKPHRYIGSGALSLSLSLVFKYLFKCILHWFVCIICKYLYTYNLNLLHVRVYRHKYTFSCVHIYCLYVCVWHIYCLYVCGICVSMRVSYVHTHIKWRYNFYVYRHKYTFSCVHIYCLYVYGICVSMRVSYGKT